MAARALLEETDLAVETIAARTGLSSAANLRWRFHPLVHTTPAAYRRFFRHDGECQFLGSSKIFVGVDRYGGRSVQQDELAEEAMTCAAIHRALDEFDLVVDSFCTAVVVGQGHGGVDGSAVAFEAVCEGVQEG